MRAIVQRDYGPIDGLHLEELPAPVPGDDEVLVRVLAAGIDAGVWHVAAGKPRLARLFAGLRRPKGPVRGSDLAGTVQAVGPQVTDYRPGDEVYGSCDGIEHGSFAELAIVEPVRLALKPANLTFEQAAAVPVSAVTALQGLRDAGSLRAGQSVLITGAGGGVGSYAVQLARAIGAEVTGVCSAVRVDLVRSLGAAHVIDREREDFTDGARRYDLILDTAGNRPLLQLRRALTERGTLVIVGGEGRGGLLGGFDRGVVRAPLVSLFVHQRLRPLTAKVNHDDLTVLTTFIERGEVTPAIDRAFPLSETGDAIRYAHEGNARGKVVVTIP